MSYRYREVLCPICEKRFMWLQTNNDVYQLGYYINPEKNKKAGKAVCTGCESALIVFDGDVEGHLPDEHPDMHFVREYGI